MFLVISISQKKIYQKSKHKQTKMTISLIMKKILNYSTNSLINKLRKKKIFKENLKIQHYQKKSLQNLIIINNPLDWTKISAAYFWILQHAILIQNLPKNSIFLTNLKEINKCNYKIWFLKKHRQQHLNKMMICKWFLVKVIGKKKAWINNQV